jgi:integrase
VTVPWVFPSEAGTLRAPSSLSKAWAKCLKAAKIEQRFTPHGMRRSFNDHLRRAGVDPVTAKSLTGHVTEGMREHYSTVRLDEKRAAVVAVAGLLPRVGNGNAL